MVIGRKVNFFIFDYGSDWFFLWFCKVMVIIDLFCDKLKKCYDCYGYFDVSEVYD